MQLLAFLSVSFVILFVAYHLIGRWLDRVFSLRTEADTPAHAMRDGLDYEPLRTASLFPQHFSAIAAAGPIVGPILAGIYFGWGPTWVWIIVGSILIGGIHDFTALLASVRHEGRSIAEIVRKYMNPRAYILFLVFIWFALVYVIIAFTDVTAETFVAGAAVTDGTAPGPAVATSSMLYLGLAVAMGFALRFTKLGPVKAKLIFLPLVFAAILIGPYIPLDLSGLFSSAETPAEAIRSTQQFWGYLLLAYCFFAALAPVWSLLQPRGELGGYFLYIVMIAALAGVLVGTFTGGTEIQADTFFKGWNSEAARGSFGYAAPLFPILFITVACGACSGFHSIVASGTTSKQLHCEADARPIAYGGMLMEGFFACISLATYMVYREAAGTPNAIYAGGIRDFAAVAVAPFLGESEVFRNALYQFGLLCFATFVFDTLDACTRLARYVLMELLGWKSRAHAIGATVVCLIIPAIALSLPLMTVGGKELPLWKVFWNIFGSSNQLLAALTLMGVSVWLAKKKLPFWIALGPAIFMMAMTIWSLILSIPPYWAALQGEAEVEVFKHLQFGITLSLLGLSSWLIVEAVITWIDILRPPQQEAGQGATASA